MSFKIFGRFRLVLYVVHLSQPAAILSLEQVPGSWLSLNMAGCSAGAARDGGRRGSERGGKGAERVSAGGAVSGRRWTQADANAVQGGVLCGGGGGG